jgi:hypothetical protein
MGHGFLGDCPRRCARGGCTEGPTGIQALGGSPMGKLLEIHIVIVSRVGIYGKDFWGLDGEDLRISMISESPPKKYGFDVFRL